ncbi:hypothetical protein, partial [Streptomyces mirabilis]|uniref:hypothetical protein n=1 Tax=Streptomyces mirabilis TaxID=68239 RepID=UPI0034020ADF
MRTGGLSSGLVGVRLSTVLVVRWTPRPAGFHRALHDICREVRAVLVASLSTDLVGSPLTSRFGMGTAGYDSCSANTTDAALSH